MKRFFALMIGALFLIANAVCSQERTSVPSEGDSVGDTSATKTDSATSCSKTEDSINAIKSQIFEDVLPLLKKAAGLLGNQDALPDKSYLLPTKRRI